MSDKFYYKKVSLNPFNLAIKSQTVRFNFIILVLIPQLIMLLVTKSYDSLAVILCAVLASVMTELDSFIKKENVLFSALYAVVSGLLIGFLLPSGYPPVSVFFLTAFFMMLSKIIFGPIGVSPVNPVVLTVSFAWFIGHFNFPGFSLSLNEFAEKNASMFLIQDINLMPFDEKITILLNDNVFKLFNVSIPTGYVSLFWDSQSVIPAFRFNFLTIVSSLVLLGLSIQEAGIPLTFIAVYSLLVKFVSPFFTGTLMMQGDVLLALLSSGTLFAAFFLLQWTGTVPMTVTGKIAYSLSAGFVAFVFNGAGTSPVGSVMTVLVMNITSPLIQLVESRRALRKLSAHLKEQSDSEENAAGGDNERS